jgi:hypothetical protein
LIEQLSELSFFFFLLALDSSFGSLGSFLFLLGEHLLGFLLFLLELVCEIFLQLFFHLAEL